MTPIEHARAILGEHFRNYVIIVQPEEDPTFFDVLHSDPFAATGLLQEGLEWHKATMSASGDEEAFVWDDEDDDEDSWGTEAS